MRIIPAIDIINGKCVRLSQGNYDSQIIYYENPIDAAKQFEQTGCQYLHIVDLDGAKKKQLVNHKVIYAIAQQTNLQIDVGGGIQTDADILCAFENGATQITSGSTALRDESLFLSWLSKYGTDKIILGADARSNKVATNAWRDTSEINVLDYIANYQQKGIEYAICTDIDKDGMLQGTSLELYEQIISAIPIKLIASGGITSTNDLADLQKLGCEGAIIGKALYEGKLNLKDWFDNSAN